VKRDDLTIEKKHIDSRTVKVKKVKLDLYSAFIEVPYTQGATVHSPHGDRSFDGQNEADEK